MLIERKSILTGKVRVKDLPITEDQIESWVQGMLAQNAFPHLTPSEREFIMTGIVDEEWENTFDDSY